MPSPAAPRFPPMEPARFRPEQMPDACARFGDPARPQIGVHQWNPVRDAPAETPDRRRSHYRVNERTDADRQVRCCGQTLRRNLDCAHYPNIWLAPREPSASGHARSIRTTGPSLKQELNELPRSWEHALAWATTAGPIRRADGTPRYTSSRHDAEHARRSNRLVPVRRGSHV